MSFWRMFFINSLILFCLLVSGCVHSYDTNQYQRFITIITLAEKFDCSKESVDHMKEEVDYLYHYTMNRPHDYEVTKSLEDIKLSLLEVRKRTLSQETMSERYCQLKMSGILINAETFATLIGRRIE